MALPTKPSWNTRALALKPLIQSQTQFPLSQGQMKQQNLGAFPCVHSSSFPKQILLATWFRFWHCFSIMFSLNTCRTCVLCDRKEEFSFFLRGSSTVRPPGLSLSSHCFSSVRLRPMERTNCSAASTVVETAVGTMLTLECVLGLMGNAVALWTFFETVSMEALCFLPVQPCGG